MKHRIPAVAGCGIVALLVVWVLSLFGTTANGSVPIGQVATLVGQKPVSGTYDAAYKDYNGKGCTGSRGCGSPSMTYYHVGTGHFQTKLNSYKIDEGLKKYDFYLLDVDVAVTDQGGASTNSAPATIKVQTSGTMVDHDDTKSITSDDSGCKEFPISVGAGMGWGNGANVGASIGVGSLKFCAKSASFKLTAGNTATYTATMLPKVRHLAIGRLVKVKAGATPTFTVTLTLPTDVCTKTGGTLSGDTVCTAFTNKTTTSTYKVGTAG